VAQRFLWLTPFDFRLAPSAWRRAGFPCCRRAFSCFFLLVLLANGAAAQPLTAGQPPPLPCSFSLDLSGLKPEDAHITQLRFYVSSPRLFHRGVQVDGFASSYHLVNALDTLSNHFALIRTNALPFDEVRLLVGVDSTTTAAGIMSGDLDPMHNMYWTWQSGYINIKLEGNWKGKDMQFHLGGFAFPNNNLQELRVSVLETNRLSFVWHAPSFFGQLPLDSSYRVMRPCAEANRLARLFTSSFSLGH